MRGSYTNAWGLVQLGPPVEVLHMRNDGGLILEDFQEEESSAFIHSLIPHILIECHYVPCTNFQRYGSEQNKAPTSVELHST